MGKTFDTKELKMEITESYMEYFELAQKAFKNMNIIGIPKNKEQLEDFNKYIKIYEDCMTKINDRFITLKSYGNEDTFNERMKVLNQKR